MRVFITGTDTDVGKTTISSWLCLHTGYDYFKPIQTGTVTDSDALRRLSHSTIHAEVFCYSQPLSPHAAARYDGGSIALDRITLPATDRLIVEGAGGVLVPLNDQDLMIDLIKHLGLPVILVARSTLGTINHTLLSLEALRQRNITVLGVILSGPENPGNAQAIETYGSTTILAQLPWLEAITADALRAIPLDPKLVEVLT